MMLNLKIFAPAFLVRIVYAYFFQWQAADTAAYNSPEVFLTTMRPPLFPFFWWLTGEYVILAQCVLGAVTVVLLYTWCKKLLPPILYTFAPLTLHYTAAPLSETVFTFLCVLGMYLWFKEKLVYSGVAMGIASLAKPIIFPVLALGLLFRERKQAAVILGIAILIALPWIVRNSILDAHITLTQKSALPQNLWYGTLTQKEFGPDIWTRALENFPADPEAAAIQRIKEDPLRYLRARAEQYPRLFIDTADQFGNWYFRLFLVLVQVGVGLIALFGMKQIEIWLIPLFLALFHIPLWVESRYFLPAIPFICLAAGYGVSFISDSGILRNLTGFPRRSAAQT